MRSERRAILALMWAGRISACDAERLLRAWNERFEGVWIAALCMVMCFTQFHLPGSSHPLGWLGHELTAQGLKLWQAAEPLLTKGMGGTI